MFVDSAIDVGVDCSRTSVTFFHRVDDFSAAAADNPLIEFLFRNVSQLADAGFLE